MKVLYPGLNTISFFSFLKLFGIKEFLTLVLNSCYSSNHYYVMKGNLKRLPEMKFRNRLKGDFRKVKESEITKIFDIVPDLTFDDKKEIVSRILFYKSGFKNCYGFFVEDEIAYLQWLIYPFENDIIKKEYSNKFYSLTPKQVMIENAFTFPKFRGHGLYRVLTHQLLEKALQEGYLSALCYTKKERIIPLNEFYLLGFKIDSLIHERKLFFKTYRNL